MTFLCIRLSVLSVLVTLFCVNICNLNALKIPCPNSLCVGKVDGNYAYPNNESYYLSCSNRFALCRYCWPLKLKYNENCDQCLWSSTTDRCWPPKIIGKVPNGWAKWASFTPCSASCDYGVMTRTRICRNKNGKCEGPEKESKRCFRKSCNDQKSIRNILQISLEILKDFFSSLVPNKEITGKQQRVLLQIQKAVARIANLGNDNPNGKTLEERIAILTEIFLKALEADNAIPFARETLGKLIYIYIRKQLKDNMPLHLIISEGVKLLQSLQKEAGDNFKDVLAAGSDEATMMFALDTTGSMRNEIGAAHSIASGILQDVSANPNIDCILSPFNDPTTGPLTKAPSSELRRCVENIEKLQVGFGGDCPELAFKGMIDAIKSGPKFGSPMFVFTDAEAKDNTTENIALLKQLAEENAISINFLLTQSSCLRTDDVYNGIASATNGQIFPLEELELPELLAYIKSTLFIDTSIVIGGTDAATKFFDVDTDIFLLIVTVKITNKDTSRHVKLIDPKGNVMRNRTLLSTAAVFEVVKPKSGKWHLSFPKLVGNLTFNVEAISEKPIEFGFNFFAEINNRLFTVFHPIAGQDNSLFVTLAGARLVKHSSLTVDMIDETAKQLIKDINLISIDNNNTFNASLVPPSIPFKLLLKGEKKDDSKFQRVSREVLNAQSSFLQVAQAGNESTVRIREKNAKIKIQVLNAGKAADYSFKMEADFGKLSVNTLTNTITGVTFLDFTYNAPTKRRFADKIDTISVTATSKSSSTVHYTFQILLLK